MKRQTRKEISEKIARADHEVSIGPGVQFENDREARAGDETTEMRDNDVDMVNNPPHYNQGDIEVIDFIDDQEHLGYHRLQAIRYITRSPFKGTEIEDLEKARWYLNRRIIKLGGSIF
jgi:hypothetical protein